MSVVRAVGFVGLGNMGRPMARNLVAAGFELTVQDVDLDREQAVASELGCSRPEGPGALEAVEAVVTMLPTGREVRDVLLAAALRPGTLAVDMSSSDPTGTRALGAELAERGVRLVDAPVSGGVQKAGPGTLTIMVGGDDEQAVERARPLLEALGEKLFRTGPLGSGHAMKALNNYVAGASYVAAAEALLVGARFGLDPSDMVEVLNASTGRSFNTEVNFTTHVLPRRFATGFSLPLMAKDVGIAAGLADAVGIEAPLCALTSRLWSEALEDEGPAADHSAAIRHWEKVNGLELPERPPPDD
jgi:3-hydroxyisobutyrate dehydrogenase